MLVVDLLHEFELGVWKAVFIHLVRLLYTLGQTVVDRFNERYESNSSFAVASDVHQSPPGSGRSETLDGQLSGVSHS